MLSVSQGQLTFGNLLQDMRNIILSILSCPMIPFILVKFLSILKRIDVLKGKTNFLREISTKYRKVGGIFCLIALTFILFLMLSSIIVSETVGHSEKVDYSLDLTIVFINSLLKLFREKKLT